MKNFTKLLFICVVFLASQMCKAQSIAAGGYTCTGAGAQTLSVVTNAGITAYSWKNASNVVVGTTASVTVPSGTYTVVYTKAGANSTLGPVTVATGIVPTATNVTPSSVATSVCGSATQTLTSTAGANYTWTRDGSDIGGATVSSYDVLGTSVGILGTYSYAVRVTNTTTNCTATSNAVSIKVSPKPGTPTINPPSASLLCGSSQTTLTATGGGSSYTWKRGGITLSSNVNTYTATGTEAATGTYNYIVSCVNSVGCSSDDSAPVSLTLSPKPATPTVSTSVASTSPICGTSTNTLTATAGGNTYSWKRDGAGISGSTNVITVTGNDVSVGKTYGYSVSSQNSAGCTSDPSLTVNIDVSPKPLTPIINSVSPNLLCGTAVAKLTATSGGTTYTWKRGTILLGEVTNEYKATGTETTAGTYNYTVSYVNSVGCSSDVSAGIDLTLSPKPATPIVSTSVVATSPICGAGTNILTATAGGNTYNWKRDGAGISGSTNIITVTGNDVATVGTYNYTVSTQNAFGCTSDESATLNLKVSPKPATPTISPVSPNILCGTDTKVLAATGGGTTYTWKRESTVLGSLINTYTATGTEAPLGTYNYTVFYVNSVGCPSDVSAPVALLLSPRPTAPTISPNSNSDLLKFCEGGSVTLTSSYTTNTNIWSRTAGGDTTTTNADGITVRTSNTISVKAKDNNGCTSLSSLPIVITVNLKPSPPVIDLSGARGVCESDSIVLTADNKGSGSYMWSNGRNNRSITVKDGGTYTLTYTDTQSPACTSLSSQPSVVTINPLPAKPTITSPDVTKPPIIEFCYRQFTTLKASSTTAGATFEWDYLNRTGSQIDVAGSAKLTTAEIIKITAKSVSVFANNPKACKSRETSDVVTITINPLPTTPNISAGGPLTFCPDSTIMLTSTDSPTGVYKWINAKDNSEFSSKKTVLIDTTSKFFSNTTLEKIGKFYVRTISDKSCVSDTSKNVIITVRNAPQPASIRADPSSATVCLGGKVTMKALVANGNIAKYSWRDESTLQEVSTEPEVSVITSGSFSVKVRDIFGCFAAYSKPLKVSINSLPNKPTLTLVKPKVFCDEDSVVVQASEASTTPKGNKTTYRWIVDGLTVTESFESKFSWKRVGVISVALTDSNGCKAAAVSDTIRTTVNPLPNAPTISVRGANPFCADKNVALSAVGVNGVTYKWSTGATTQNITTNTAGNIFVQAINSFGCLSKSSQPVLIRVNPLPTAPKLTANGDVTFCEGSKVRIVSSSAFKAYWFRSTTDSIGLGEDNTSIFVSKTGNYFAKIQDDNGCISLASAPIAVDSKPNPTPTIIKQIGSFTLDAQGLGDENGYLWRFNGDLQKDLTTRLIKAKKDGSYQVQASITYTGVNIAGGKLVCYSKVSDAIKYVQDISFEGISIFPNPSIDGVINIEAAEDLVGTKIMIYDLYGRIMTDYTIDKLNTLKRVELPNLHGTTYIIKISSGGLEKTRKVLIY